MSEKFITTWFYAGLGKYKVDTGIFRQKIEHRVDQTQVDFDSFAENLKKIYNDFDHIGYDVENVIPIAMGQSENCFQKGGNYVGDVGFSITRGAVVVGKKRG